jgi:hypothetical protein
MKKSLICKPFTLIVLCCLSAFTGNLYADESNQNNDSLHIGGWVTFGFGDCNMGLAGNTSFSFAYNANIFTLRYVSADESRLFINPGGGVYDTPQLSFSEKGILYGRCYKEEFLMLSFSCGVGFMNGIDRGKKLGEKVYEQINISTYVIPFEARFMLEIGFISIGGAWFGNLNNQKSISGGLLELSIGVF